ncbi:DUF6477 family protein [Thioclava sp. GXIMD2076]|uniref:DUF6477 family protein n=1 Tax=Thioclava sp. GXIMD2076 TaxID=3131931 RepID=UPI0030D33711
MTEFDNRLEKLKRPKLLVRAARIGAALYKPERDLRRIMVLYQITNTADILTQLLEKEAEIDSVRRRVATQWGKYDPARHIELLAAIIWEARDTAQLRAL